MPGMTTRKWGGNIRNSNPLKQGLKLIIQKSTPF